MQRNQRNFGREVWCWRHRTSEVFFRGAVNACAAVRDFFKSETLGRGAANFGRNNQIYDSWARHARELEQAIEFTKYDDFQPIRDAASDVTSTNRGVNQWVYMGWLGEAEAEYNRLAEIAEGYAKNIMSTLQCGLVGGAYWLKEAANDPPERRNDPLGLAEDAVTVFLQERDYRGKTPEENYPHLRAYPVPEVFPHYAPDRSRPCKTGETVPWTGVWYPDGDIEKDRLNLTFAIAGRPMTPVWRLVKTDKEVEQDLLKLPGYTKDEFGLLYNEKGELVTPFDQYEITPITWYPMREVQVEKRPFVMRVEGGEPCPREGHWWSPANQSKGRVFKKGEIMPIVESTEYGICYWLWSGKIEEE